jgi:NAD(P)-dependent dehydrogenase (short-subunit alcohol dehydrogenase family)
MTLEKFRLDGKIALITGGTRGIGLAIAHIIERRLTKALISARWTAGPNDTEYVASYHNCQGV